MKRKGTMVKVRILVFLIVINFILFFIESKNNEVEFLGYKCKYKDGTLIEKSSKKILFDGQVDINGNPIYGVVYNINSIYNTEVFTGYFNNGKINGWGIINSFEGFKDVIKEAGDIKLINLDYYDIKYEGNFINNIPSGVGKVWIDNLTILDTVEYNVNIKNNNIELLDDFMSNIREKFIEKSTVIFDQNNAMDMFRNHLILNTYPNVMSYIHILIEPNNIINDMRAVYLGAELAGNELSVVNKDGVEFNLYNNYEIRIEELIGMALFIINENDKIELYFEKK